jgi:hypothetical protein
MYHKKDCFDGDIYIYIYSPVITFLIHNGIKPLKLMLCYVMLCYVMLCYVMLCYVMLCYVQNVPSRPPGPVLDSH